MFLSGDTKVSNLIRIKQVFYYYYFFKITSFHFYSATAPCARVKGVQADGQDWQCRMLTIRQKTLIAFN